MHPIYHSLANDISDQQFVASIPENVDLLEAESDITLDPWRWYIVAVFGLLALMQGLTWSIPGILQSTMKKVHGLTNDQIQFLLNYGPLAWFLVCIPASWMIDRWGSRLPVLLSIWAVFASSIIRLFARDSSMRSFVLLHISFFLNGLAGPIAVSACSKISEDWFPPSMRSTATAVMNQANFSCGIVLCIMVPLLVPVEDESHLHQFNWACVGIATLSVLMAHFHFPSTPVQAPSPSAQEIKTTAADITLASLWLSVKNMLCNRNFLLLFCAYGILNGFASMFNVELPVQLQQIGVNQSNSAYIGIAANVVLVVVSVLVARFTDPRHQRTGLIRLLVVSLLSCGVFACLIQRWLILPNEPGQLSSSVPIGSPTTLSEVTLILPLSSLTSLTSSSFTNSSNRSLNESNSMLPLSYLVLLTAIFSGTTLAATAATPLIFEMCVEFSFGIGPEGTSIMLINSASSVTAAISLFVPIDALGVRWIPWAYVGVLTFCILCSVAIQFDVQHLIGILSCNKQNQQPRYAFDQIHAHQQQHHEIDSRTHQHAQSFLVNESPLLRN